jgi:diguanylate cyclase (GGDEF)-like protein
MRLVLITEERETADHARGVLVGLGLEVVEVDADRAVEREPEEADLVLLLTGRDHRMALLPALVARDGERARPVLALCPGDRPEDRADALRQGADDALSWPADPGELRARLDHAQHLHQRMEALAQLSSTDALTGIANRRQFEARLAEELRRAHRYGDPFSLVLLDIDHFKQVNDQHGHLTGDVVLIEVARSIQRAVRDTDLVARHGGEEFAVLLPRTQLAGALTVAERVRAELHSLRPLPDSGLRITASLGIAGYPNLQPTGPVPLFEAADSALYRAKREGRDRICLHTAGPSSLLA